MNRKNISIEISKDHPAYQWAKRQSDSVNAMAISAPTLIVIPKYHWRQHIRHQFTLLTVRKQCQR
ncbi:hypothetical protein L4D21_22495 [Photobacterium profundum]|uniref:hypothetical protein n=1 Tax=Photobacterium profundum TaxID=74109 RepID=UPI003D14AF13